MLQIVFRADASLQMGTGHVMRCLTLADALAAQGAECQFICREHPGNLIEFIRSKGYTAHALPTHAEPVGASLLAIKATDDAPAHSHWLGATQEQDAEACAMILAELQPDWLIVDHYALDARWETALKPNYRRLMVIDDLADRPHQCDLLLDQNWFAAQTTVRYNSLVPKHALMLLGPKYALLKPEYAQLRALMPQRDGIVRRVLVLLGGSDPTNQTAKVLQALMTSDLAYLAADIVIGVNHPDPAGIAALVAKRPATILHQNLPSLAGLMARADLMIGAGGSTTWERMSLGLPCIVISIAVNQTPTNIALMDAGYISFIGEMNQVTTVGIENAVRRSLAVPHDLKTQSVRMQQFVPATGASLLCKYLLTSEIKNVTSSTH